MWVHISKVDGKLFQDGKEVKQISVEGSIADIVVKENVVWLNFK